MFRLIARIFLRVKTAGIIIILLTLIIALFHLHPMFKVLPDMTLAQLLSQSGEPLKLEDVPKRFGKLLQDYPSVAERIPDAWGVTYPPYKPEEEIRSSLHEQVQGVNNAIRSLKNYDLKAARVSLSGFHNFYQNKVKGINKPDDKGESALRSKAEEYMYALTRYTRGIVLLRMANFHQDSERDRDNFLSLALYDLRRSVGTFENKLGYVRSDNIYSEYGDFQVHWAYVTLAAAYLRAKDVSGYPGIERSYLRYMDRKYSYGEIGISPFVRNYVDLFLKKEVENSHSLYRLIHALHNLEFCERKLKDSRSADDPRFNYMVGVVLRHLGRMSPRDLRNQAYSQAYNNYLQRVADNDKAEDILREAALKEQILLAIERGKSEQVIEKLKRVNPLRLRDAISKISGPDKSYALLFTDLAQYDNFSKGALDKVIEYDEERKGDSYTEKAGEFHDKALLILSEAFFTNLSERFEKLENEGRTPEIGAALSNLYKKTSLRETSYISQGTRKLKSSFSVNINTLFHISESFQTYIMMIKWVLPIILIIYLWILFSFHRKMAKKMLESRYQEG